MLAIDAVDLLHWPGLRPSFGIEAPDAFHQALPPQHFVATGDAAVKIVGDVEEGAVAVGDAGIEREQIGRHGLLVPRGLAALELLDRRSRSTPTNGRAVRLWNRCAWFCRCRAGERQHQVEQDVVVIAGVERDAVERTGGGDAAYHVERAIAVERRDLDRDHIVDLGEALPELCVEDEPPTAGWR